LQSAGHDTRALQAYLGHRTFDPPIAMAAPVNSPPPEADQLTNSESTVEEPAPSSDTPDSTERPATGTRSENDDLDKKSKHSAKKKRKTSLHS
jgi:hypothetical protein